MGLTGSSVLNYIENAIFDTNQIRYYSAESGLKDALYQERRDLSNLMQKLEDQGYEIPESVSSITSAATKTASTNSKGRSMINSAIASRSAGTAVSATAGFSIKDTVKNALEAGGYTGIETDNNTYAPRNKVYAPRRDIYVKGNDKIVEFGTGTYVDKEGNTTSIDNIYKGVWGEEKLVSEDNKVYRKFTTVDGKEYFLNQSDNNLVAWHQTSNFEEEISRYKQAYEDWKALPVEERPKVWYDLYSYDSSLSPEVYNEMVMSSFNTEKLKRWFNANTKNIVWKQLS